MLLLFEGFGGVETRAYAQEQRTRIDRQSRRKVIGEHCEIESFTNDDPRHAGAGVMAGDLDAVGGGIDHALAFANGIVDLAGRDILALPAEGIADPVDEMEEALLVEPHQIAGAEPGVAFCEDVAQDFLLGFGLVGIALEATASLIRGANASDRFPGFGARTGDAEAVFATHGRAAAGINLDDRGRKAMRQQRRDAADRTGFALDVVEREIAFGRRIEFEDLRDREPRPEFLPDV